jgi:hypothetical protein
METGATENKMIDPTKRRKLRGWKFNGKGALPGVPMRDIPAWEAKARNIESQLDESPDYTRVYEEA